MVLALQATKYMIWIHVFAGLMVLVLFGMKPDRVGLSPIITSLADLGILCLFFLGLKRQRVWVAVVFTIFCIFDLFGAIGGGLEIANLLNLADAILSFVAICGIMIWFRDRPNEDNHARLL